jgi:hypothetical protein
MAESNINVTPGSGGPNIDLEIVDNGNARQVIVIGDSATATKVAPVDATLGLSVNVTNSTSPLPTGAATAANQAILIANQINGSQVIQPLGASLCQSATAATGVGVTATLPAVASQFHYISLIQIKKYFTVANAASATPLVVTTTNLPGSLAFTFGQPLGTIGTTDSDILMPEAPLKSSVLNTATTIVCPATTGIIWRVNVFYFVAL